MKERKEGMKRKRERVEAEKEAKKEMEYEMENKRKTEKSVCRFNFFHDLNLRWTDDNMNREHVLQICHTHRFLINSLSLRRKTKTFSLLTYAA